MADASATGASEEVAAEVTAEAPTRAAATFDEEETCILKHFYTRYIFEVAGLLGSRARIAHTAVYWWRRFFFKRLLHDHDPVLLAVTALFAAHKVEECPLDAKKLLAKLPDDSAIAKIDSVPSLIACELELLEGLGFGFHTCQPSEAVRAMLAEEDQADRGDDGQRLAATALFLANDCFKSDIVLFHTQEVIALACLSVAAVTLQIECPPRIRQRIDSEKQAVDETRAALLTLLESSERLAQKDAVSTGPEMGICLHRQLVNARARNASGRWLKQPRTGKTNDPSPTPCFGV